MPNLEDLKICGSDINIDDFQRLLVNVGKGRRLQRLEIDGLREVADDKFDANAVPLASAFGAIILHYQQAVMKAVKDQGVLPIRCVFEFGTERLREQLMEDDDDDSMNEDDVDWAVEATE
ncbi:hypothetical protein HDV00_001424 [Rhizophlyctis rosea]|nr:hypothetical protein HDV00_001424 [Rhizophlyctis rosea]